MHGMKRKMQLKLSENPNMRMKKLYKKTPMLYIDACSPMAIMTFKYDWYPYLHARNILEGEYKRNFDKISWKNYQEAKIFTSKKLDNDDIDEIYTVEQIEAIINEAINMMYV